MPCEMAFAVSEGEPKDVAIQRGGDPARPGKVVARQFVDSVWSGGSHAIQSGSGRLQLADWITDPKHPLTRRVFVNRVWQWHFGRGIVGTPDNFGHRGEAPTHPELLDYLATAFAEDGWSSEGSASADSGEPCVPAFESADPRELGAGSGGGVSVALSAAAFGCRGDPRFDAGRQRRSGFLAGRAASDRAVVAEEVEPQRAFPRVV